MSAKVEVFWDRLRDRLNAIEGWLESVKAEIRVLPWNARRTVQCKLKEARAKLQAQKERVEQTRIELKSPPQMAAELLVESVIGWKAKPNVPEPHAGLDAAEAHASATIDHAAAGIDEVKDAMLYAAAAQLPAAQK
jgi:hypothetical protein